jgi:hypothetical protein
MTLSQPLQGDPDELVLTLDDIADTLFDLGKPQTRIMSH